MAFCKTRQNQDNQKISLKVFHTEAASTAIENAGIAYQSPSLIAAGGDAQSLSFLSFLTNILFSFFCINAPGLIQRLGPAKKVTVVLEIINIATWLPIAIIFIFGLAVSPMLLIVLWVLNVLPSLLCVPLRDSWLADIIPGSKVGRYLSVRAVVSGTAYLSSFYIMGLLLDHFNSTGSTGFAIVFGIATLAAGGSLFLYRFISPPSNQVAEKASVFSLGDFARDMSHENLGRLIIFVAIFNLAVNLCGPLFAIYMIKDLNFSYLTFTLLISAEYSARILSCSIWGRYADDSGNLRLLGIVARLIPFIPILWLISSNIGYLVGIQVFSGILWAGFDLHVQTIIYRAAPAPKRLKFIIYHKSLSTMGMAIGALAGAYLLNFVVPIFGSPILTLFLVSGICRFAVVKIMFHRLIDVTFQTQTPETDLAPQWASLLAANPGEALYYHPDQWSRFVGVIKPRPIVLRRDPETGGVYYRPSDWKIYVPQQNPVKSVEKCITPAHPSKQALLYHPELWDPKAANLEIVAAKEPSKAVLFHHPASWTRFDDKFQSAASNTFMRTPVPRLGLLRRPQEWSRFVDCQTPAAPVRFLVLKRTA